MGTVLQVPTMSTTSTTSLLVSALVLFYLAQTGSADNPDPRGLLDDIGNLFGGEDTTEAVGGVVQNTTTTPAPNPPNPLEIIGTIIEGNGIPLEDIATTLGIKKDPLPNPFNRPLLFASHQKVQDLVTSLFSGDPNVIMGKLVDLVTHLA